MERVPVRTVAVPEPLDRCGPLTNALDFVKDKDGAAGALGLGPRPHPSADNPAGVQLFVGDCGQATRCYRRCGGDGSSSRPSPEFRRGLIGGEIQSLDAIFLPEPCKCLPDDGGLACLTWAGERNDPFGLLAEAAEEGCDLGSFEGRHGGDYDSVQICTGP